MVRRWSMGALTAIAVAIVSALTVAATPSGARWQFAFSLTAQGFELSATTQNARIALTL